MVSSSTSLSNLMKETLLRDSLTEQLQAVTDKKNEKTKNILERVSENSRVISSTLDKDTLQNLIDGKYDISLKHYTNLSTYNLMMSNLYGDNSANPFQKTLSNLLGGNNLLENNNLLGNQENALATAKTFVETMKERGFSNAAALKMYSAFQNYSVMNNLNILNNSSFVNAKI